MKKNFKSFSAHRSVAFNNFKNKKKFEFYTKDKSKNVGLHVKPFFVFNLQDYSGSDLEILALFHRRLIDVKIIEETADEIYFLDKFDDALYTTLKMPKAGHKPTDGNKKLLEIIFRNMGGKRFTDNVINDILPLVNGKKAFLKFYSLAIRCNAGGWES